ncbi:MAG: hypothetical protein LBQ94_06790 [Treponema sp.]|jgi:hypothetical protein|nr:hypothetical protein [Treponema sp.]
MTRKDFRKFYEGTVCKLADKLVENNKNLSFVSNFGGLYEEYLNQRTLLKFVFEKQNTGDLLDRHKVSACITAALMKIRLLHPNNLDDQNNYSLSKSSRMNEQLAFFAGIHAMSMYMAEDGKAKETLKGDFILPKTRYEEESKYYDSIVRALYYSNTLSGFNTLLIANIYFLLEEYHKLSYLANQKNKDSQETLT